MSFFLTLHGASVKFTDTFYYTKFRQTINLHVH